MVLNEEGLSFHKAGAASNHLEAKRANTTAFDGQVYKTIPAAWSTKPEMIAMRLQSVTTAKKLVRSRAVTLTFCGHQIENRTGSIGDRKHFGDSICDR